MIIYVSSEAPPAPQQLEPEYIPKSMRGRGGKRGSRGRPPLTQGSRSKRPRVERNYQEMDDAVSSIVQNPPKVILIFEILIFSCCFCFKNLNMKRDGISTIIWKLMSNN